LQPIAAILVGRTSAKTADRDAWFGTGHAMAWAITARPVCWPLRWLCRRA